MHPLRETIKISGERERERGQEAAMMAAAARSFAIRDSAYATSSRVRNPDLERRSSVRFPFRNTCVLFDSRLSVAFYPSPLSPIPFPSSLITCPSTFNILVIFHSSLALAFILFFLFSLFPLSSDFPSSSSTRLACIRGTRGKFRKGESEDEGRHIDTYSHPFACITAIYSRVGRDPFTRVRASKKRFENLHEGGAGGAAKAKICARSRYVLASIVRNFDGRERERDR